MGHFRRIYDQMWEEEWFIDLTPSSKLLYIYLRCHANPIGIVRIRPSICSAHTGLRTEELSGLISEISELSIRDDEYSSIYVDERSVCWITDFVYNDSPDNPNAVKSWKSRVNRIRGSVSFMCACRSAVNYIRQKANISGKDWSDLIPDFIHNGSIDLNDQQIPNEIRGLLVDERESSTY